MQTSRVPLAVFGCSWSCPVEFNYTNNGRQVTDQQTYGFLLSQMLESSVYTNMALMGSSVSRSVLQLIRYIKELRHPLRDSIAVFQLTSPDRECLITERNKIIDLKLGDADILSKHFYADFYSLQDREFQLHKNLLSLQSLCRSYNIRDYYIGTWEPFQIPTIGIDTSRIFSKTIKNLLQESELSEKCLLNCGHPSAEGHELMANVLYNWITKHQTT